jgi:F-type H+-transporting ATPase subunit gamma
MSRLRSIERRRASLGEIRDIMNSMKSLAYMEARKLGRLVEAGHARTAAIEAAAADLVYFHADMLPATGTATAVRILVGSERGFCGDLNQVLWRRAVSERADTAQDDAILIAVGQKLRTAIEAEGGRAASYVDGAGIAEEVPGVFASLVGELDALRTEHGPIAVASLHYDSEGRIVTRALLPAFGDLAAPAPAPRHPPDVNLRPSELLLELTDQYLDAGLNDVLFTSLLHENQRRMTHLDAAVRHLDDKSSGLTHQANALRQEEITEEIEVILLSAGGAGTGPPGRKPQRVK